MNFAVWAPDAEGSSPCLFDAEGREELHRLALPVCSEGEPGTALPGGAFLPRMACARTALWRRSMAIGFNPAKLLFDPWAQEVVGNYGRQGPGTADDAALAARLAAFRAARGDDARLPDARDNAAVAPKARVPFPIARVPVPMSRVPVPMATYGRPPARAFRASGWCSTRPTCARNHHAPPGDSARTTRQLRGAGPPGDASAHYRSLGITTLSPLPLHFRADEAALQRRGLANHWGYAPLAWLGAGDALP